MPSNPFKTLIKTILTDKQFNCETFLSNGNSFHEFWSLFMEYVTKLYLTPTKDSGLFKRNKFSTFKKIYEVLQKVLPYTQLEHYSDDILGYINKLFCGFFHPDTSNNIRKQMLSFFLIIMKKLTTEKLTHLKDAVAMIVPFYRLANEEEKKLFQSYLFDVQKMGPLIDPSVPAGTDEEVVIDLQTFTKFIVENWNSKTIDCITLLNDNILSVIYKGSLPDCFESTPQYGFFSEPPYQLTSAIIQFFSDVSNSSYFLNNFLEYGKNIMLIIGISRMLTKTADYITTLEFLIFIFSTNIYLDILLKKEPSIISEIGKIFFQYLNAIKQENINEPSTQHFFDVCFQFMDKLLAVSISKFGSIEAVTNFTKLMDDTEKNSFTLAFVLQKILNYFVSNQIWDKDTWRIIVDLISSKLLFSATASKFSEYLAAYSFQSLYSIEFEEALQICQNHIRRKQRTKQATPHDFVAENIETLIKTPHLFIKNVKSNYEPFKEFDEILSNVNVIPLDLQPQNIPSVIDNYLSVFDVYSEMKSPEIQQNCFVVISSFCHFLDRLRFIPAGIQYKRYVPFVFCSRILFKAILSHDNISIRKIAFNTLSNIINLIEIQQYLTNTDYSNWYASLVIMLLTNDDECRKNAFKSAVITIQNGFEGSSMLLGLMINECEKGLIPINESYVSLIISLPLFDVETAFPESFLKSIKSFIEKNKEYYIPNCLEMFSNHDLRKRSINLILKLQTTRNWPLILPAYSALIADELTHEKPDKEVLSKIIEYLVEPLNEESYESIITTRSLLMYNRCFEELIPEKILQFITSITNQVISFDPKAKDKEAWQFQLLRLIGDIYIHYYKITCGTEIYHKFSEFLTTSAKKELFTENINTLIVNLKSLISTYYGAYPFPQTPSFPTHISPTINIKEDPNPPVFGTYGTVIHPTYDEDGNVQIACQGNTGNYVWKFTEIDQTLYSESELETINVPITNNLDYIPPSILNPEEKEYSNVFNKLLEDYKQEFKDESFEMEEFPSTKEQIENAIKQIKSATSQGYNDEKIKFPRQKIFSTNPIAGALTACGRYPINHPENFNIVNQQNYPDLLEKAQKQTHRLGLKIGVIFVGPNVDDQNQILATKLEKTSPHFQEFCTGLGWPIELKSHVGYDGSLDINRNGKSSIYYADFMNEIMFHIAPLLPTDPNDSQQIYKKRHIGNDHIHIVWCEQGRDYDITTITSQFNQAHIVIYPLSNGLFHVDIHWRSDCGWFSPLRYPIVLSKVSLPSLVRATSVSAMNSYYFQQEITRFVYPQNEWAKIIKSILPTIEKKDSDRNTLLSIEKLMEIKKKQ